jgi:hypothetical protein
MHTQKLRRRRVPSLGVLALSLALLALAAPVHAQKIDKRRAEMLDRIASLEQLQAVVSLEQATAGVFWPDPRGSQDPSYTFSMATQPSITGGSFAAGAVGAGLGFLMEGALVKSGILILERESQVRLLALNARGSFDAMHAAWRATVVRAVADSDWVTGDVVEADVVDRESSSAGGPCPERDHCLWVDTRWGLSWDGRHLETQTTVSVWSPHLRKRGASADRNPDFSNLLVYLSDPVNLPERPGEDDREALRRLAMEAYAFNGIAALVEQAKSSGKVEAGAARRKAIPMLETHRRRMRAAGAARWNRDTEAYRRAQIWGANDGMRLAATLDEALGEVEKMLGIELSASGQAAKTRLRFPYPDRFKEASVVVPGERRIVYLNDRTLVSLPAGVEFTQVWPLHYSEAIEYVPASEARVEPEA